MKLLAKLFKKKQAQHNKKTISQYSFVRVRRKEEIFLVKLCIVNNTFFSII